MKQYILLLVLLLVPGALALTTTYNESFDGASTGFIGGTHDTVNDWYDTTNNWSTWTSEDLNLSSYTWVQVCWSGYLEANHTTQKIYFYEETSTTTNDHLLQDTSGGEARFREEDGYTQSYTHGYSGWNDYCMRVNETADTMQLYVNGTSRWTATGTAINGTAGRDYMRFSTGDLNGASEFRIDNVTVEVSDNEVQNGSSDYTLSVVLDSPTASADVERGALFNFTVNVTCSGACGNVSAYLDPATTLIDPTADGAFVGSTTNQEDYNSLVNEGMFQTLPVNSSWKTITTDYGTSLWIIKYDSSTDFYNMNGCNGDTKASYDMSNNFLVTDEFSGAGQLISMSDNETLMQYFVNTVRAINASDHGFGSLTEWCVSIDGNTLNKTHTSDTASDADARIIDALLTCSANTQFTQDLRDSCYNVGSSMAQDLVTHNILSVSETNSIEGSTLVYAPCGGSNVCTGMTNSGFMYTGYYGDVAIALLKAGLRTGNSTYTDVADDVALWALQASGTSSSGYWNATSGFRTIEGVHHKWNTATPRRSNCTDNCGANWDYSDAPRLTSLGVYEYQRNLSGTSGNSNLTNYLSDWAASQRASTNEACTTSTAYSIQYYPNGSCSGTPNSGFYETGLGSQLLFWTNQTLVESYLDGALGSNHYNPTGKKWDSTGEFGVYRQTFPIRSYGVAMGLDSGSYTLLGNNSKGLISTTPGTTPFYTTSLNPQQETCLQNMTDTDVCQVTWTVNTTGTTGESYLFFAYANGTDQVQYTSNSISLTIINSSESTLNITLNDVLSTGDERYFTASIYNSSNLIKTLTGTQVAYTSYTNTTTYTTNVVNVPATVATVQIQNMTLNSSIQATIGQTVSGRTTTAQAFITYQNGTTYASNNDSVAGIGTKNVVFTGWSTTEPIDTIEMQLMSTSVTSASAELTSFTYERKDKGYITTTVMPGSYVVYLNDSNWALSSANVTALQDTTHQVEINGYADPSIVNLYLYDETTNTLVTTESTITLIGTDISYTTTTSNGTATITSVANGDYQIIYYNNSEVPREYYTTFEGFSVKNLNLYVIPEGKSTFYLPIEVDRTGAFCQDNTISLLRYYTDINGYRVVEMARTDSQGQAVLRVEPNTVAYKLVFTGDCGDYTSPPEKFIATTNTYTVLDTTNYLTSLENLPSITRSLYYVNDTDTFVYTWLDTNNLVTRGCLVVNQITNGLEVEAHNNCTESTSGSLIYTVNDTVNSSYYATGYIDTNTEFSTWSDTIQVSFLESFDNFGLLGVLLAFFVVITFAFMGAGSTETTVIATVVGLVLVGSFGFIYGTVYSVVGLIIVAGLIAYKSRT